MTTDEILAHLAGLPDHAVVVSVWPWPDGGWMAGIALTDRDWAMDQEMPDTVLDLVECTYKVKWDLFDGYAHGINVHGHTPHDALANLFRAVYKCES